MSAGLVLHRQLHCQTPQNFSSDTNHALIDSAHLFLTVLLPSSGSTEENVTCAPDPPQWCSKEHLLPNTKPVYQCEFLNHRTGLTHTGKYIKHLMFIHFYHHKQLFRKQRTGKWAHFLQPLTYFSNYKRLHKYVTVDFFSFPAGAQKCD